MAKDKKYHCRVEIRQTDNGWTVEYSRWLVNDTDHSGCIGPYGSSERESWTKVAKTRTELDKLISAALG